MPSDGLRVALITSVAPIAEGLVTVLRDMGHEPVVILAPRRPRPAAMPPDLLITDVTAPRGVDVVLARDKWSIEPMLRVERPDLLLCWGFPWLIPTEALAVPPLGSVNLHPALLPRHRGPTPLAWAIRDGDPTYGVTWHRMEGAFDTGPILAQASVPMEPDDADIRVVAPRVAEVALRLLPDVFRRVAAGDRGDPQNPTGDEPYAAFFDEDYASIDWSEPVRAVHAKVRAWSLMMGMGRVEGPIAVIEGRRVRVLRTATSDPGGEATRIECGDGPIWILATEPASDPAGAEAASTS